MNRRYAIKSVVVYGLAAVVVGSVFEVLKLNQKVDKDYIKSRKKLIEELAELIIPATDTPGAREAGVADYIIYAVSENLSRKEAANFTGGLREVEGISKSRYKKSFIECSRDEKVAILMKVKKNESLIINNGLLQKAKNKFLGTSFFDMLKYLTVVGYCTSELGATKGLAYVDIPVNFEPCVPLQPGQKCWATK